MSRLTTGYGVELVSNRLKAFYSGVEATSSVSNKLRTVTLLQRCSLGVRRAGSWQAQSNPSTKSLLEARHFFHKVANL